MRRDWLVVALVVAGLVLAACAPATPQVIEVPKEVVVEKPVVQTVVVEKEVPVEKKVVETVVVEKKVVETVVVEKEKVITATPVPKAASILRIGTTQDIRTLDPHKTTGSADKPAFDIFNALTRGGVNGEPIPDLAESWENPDPKTYIFKLHKNVKFHNGRPFTAKDVVFSYNRVLDPALGSRYRGQLTQIDTMEIIDDYTLKITLKEPFAPFLVYLQDVRIVAEETVDQLASKPIGTGPFQFVEWVPNDHMTLKKNPDYWQEGLPKVDQIIYQIARDTQSMKVAFKTGQLDMLLSGGLTPQDIKELGGIKGVVLYSPPVEARYALLLLDCAHPPTNDVRVRRAVAHAVNREVMSKLIYDGVYPPAYTLFPPDHWAYNPYILQPEYDLKKAEALFKEAGVKKLTFTTWAAYPEYIQQGEILQQELSKIGVELEIIALETSQFIAAVYPKDKEYNIANTSYLREIDPDGWLKYYYSDKASAGNETNYNNSEIDALLIQARSELDQAKRKVLYDEIQKIIVQDVPKITLVFVKTIIPAYDYVRDFSVPYKGDEPYLREVWLQK